MDTRSITILKAILAEGSFQKAAQRLNCSQSTVSFQIRQLEEELSVRLFERVGRRMIFTQAGKNILPYLESILHSLQAAVSLNTSSEMTGELRVGVAESLLSYKIHSILGSFVKEAPAVKIELHSLNCHDIQNGLCSGKYDLGIYYDVGTASPSLELTPLGMVRGVIVASPALSQELRDFDSPHQKKDISFIINEPRSIYRERMEAYLRSKDIMLRNTIELWSIESIKKTVAANLGVSFLPLFAVQQELAKRTLVELPSAMPSREVQAIYAWHRNREQTPAMRLFIRLVQTSRLFDEGQAPCHRY